MFVLPTQLYTDFFLKTAYFDVGRWTVIFETNVVDLEFLFKLTKLVSRNFASSCEINANHGWKREQVAGLLFEINQCYEEENS